MKARAASFSLLLVAGLALGSSLLGSDEVDREELARMVQLLDVDPGESFADVGAGDGRFSFALARIVGEEGSIFATEVDPGDRKEMEERVRREGLENVEVIAGTQQDTGLPGACCHGILLRRVYHHFQDPGSMQASLKRALREDGLLLIVEFETRSRWRRPEGVPASRDGHGVDSELVISEMELAGFELVREVDWNGGDYGLLFRLDGALE